MISGNAQKVEGEIDRITGSRDLSPDKIRHYISHTNIVMSEESIALTTHSSRDFVLWLFISIPENVYPSLQL